MIYRESDIAGRTLKNNISMFLTTIIGVALSLALIIAMVLFTVNNERDTMNRVKELVGDIDVSVSDSNKTGFIDDGFLSKVESWQEIKNLSPLYQGFMDVHFTGENWARGVYTLGVDAQSEIVRSRYHFATNKLMSKEIIINEELMTQFSLSIGDSVNISGNEFNIVENVRLPGTTLSSDSPDFAIISLSDYQQLSGQHAYDYLLISLKDLSQAEQIQNELEQISPEGSIDLWTIDTEELSGMKALNSFIWILAAVVLAACLYLTMSSLRNFITSYENQIAVLKMTGASFKQIYKIVFLQGFFIASSGAAAGFALSWVFSRLMQLLLNIIIEAPAAISYSLPVALGCTVGFLLITFVFMTFPILKCRKIAPQRMQQLASNDSMEPGRARKYTGLFLLGASVLCFILKIMLYSNNQADSGLDILFLATFALGLILSLPYLIHSFVAAVKPVLRAVLRGVADFTCTTVLSHLKSSLRMILSIALVITTSTFGSTILQSINENSEAAIRNEYIADAVITDRNESYSKLDESFRLRLEETPGVQIAAVVATDENYYLLSPLSPDPSSVKNDYAYASLPELLSILNYEEFQKNSDYNWEQDVLVTRTFADENNIKTGDCFTGWIDPNFGMTIETVNGKSNYIKYIAPTESYTHRVAGIIDRRIVAGTDIYLDWSSMNTTNGDAVYYKSFVRTDDPDAFDKAFATLALEYPSIRYNSLDNALEENGNAFAQRFSIFAISLIVIVFFLSTSILNLMLKDIERKRAEYATMRMMGCRKSEVFNSILSQTFIYITSGALIGALTGILLASTFIMIDQESIVTFSAVFPLYIYLLILLFVSALLVPKIRKMMRIPIKDQMNAA